ncbi:hypothetical protein RhiirC2_771337 [Rhizophagus irregularis]|uniref:Uncharacterized protein n=1 Tax=Rhizophagus irregularis TaxID=588596 RepID=A0A2N1NU56_9GLOM|nr:hypothetical protein RhiirC2_771337 [Rhizophagus irregularis]
MEYEEQITNYLKSAKYRTWKKAEKLAKSLNIDEEIENFLNDKGLMKQEVQQEPDQDQQVRSVVPYALYESDTHYTIVAYIPGLTSKKQLSVGMDDEKLLMIEVKGSLYNSDNNKFR